MKFAELINRFAFALHTWQRVRGSSVMRCTTSKV
jgi:hypothetical protein